MILYLTAGLFGGYNETIKFEELGISTHSLTRRLTRAGNVLPYMRQYDFNSQPHKEADSARNDLGKNSRISTHSLTRRLTDPAVVGCKSISISTHSLTRRLTYPCHLLNISDDISTHSLTRRLTNYRPETSTRYGHFNSQPHKEADHLKAYKADRKATFQLTASQGG